MSCAFTLQASVEVDSVVAIRSFHWQNSSILETRPVLFEVVRIEKRDEEQVVATVRLQGPEKNWPAGSVSQAPFAYSARKSGTRSG